MGALSIEIAVARDTLLDEVAPYRISDTKFVNYANAFVRELALLRPDLFATIGEITCAGGTCLQSAPSTALVLMDVFQVKNGRVVTRTERDALDRFNSGWMNDTAAAAKHWMRRKDDPNHFFIYPKSPVSQILIGQWAALPALMANADAIIPTEVTAAYYPALHHYMVFRAEAKDDEFAVNGRAKLFYDAYTALVGTGKLVKDSTEKPDKQEPPRNG